MTIGNIDINLPEDFEDFFNHPLNGYVIADTNGRIVRVNTTFANWSGYSLEDLIGKSFTETLAIGGKIYYETHLRPLLRMQKYFEEVALELLCKNGNRLPVMTNALEHGNKNNIPNFIQYTIYKAIDRRNYEQNLLHAKTTAEDHLTQKLAESVLREQFIAVLGHDLRNPLQAILAGASIISKFGNTEQEVKISDMIHRSALRMNELIDNIMDFANARLGSGLSVIKSETELQPSLEQVIEELIIAYPSRIIESKLQLNRTVNSDKNRIGQLLSNLIANALTHGSHHTPVIVESYIKNDFFELIVTNNGKAIEKEIIPNLFKPFTREESTPSKNGLGLGLFIASEIAKAHNGQLTVKSDDQNTKFIFRMPV